MALKLGTHKDLHLNNVFFQLFYFYWITTNRDDDNVSDKLPPYDGEYI